MKKRHSIFILIFVVSLITACAPKPEVVIFNDKIMEEMIRETMNIPDGDILVSDAETITRLELGIEWDLN